MRIQDILEMEMRSVVMEIRTPYEHQWAHATISSATEMKAVCDRYTHRLHERAQVNASLATEIRSPVLETRTVWNDFVSD